MASALVAFVAWSPRLNAWSPASLRPAPWHKPSLPALWVTRRRLLRFLRMTVCVVELDGSAFRMASTSAVSSGLPCCHVVALSLGLMSGGRSNPRNVAYLLIGTSRRGPWAHFQSVTFWNPVNKANMSLAQVLALGLTCISKFQAVYGQPPDTPTKRWLDVRYADPEYWLTPLLHRSHSHAADVLGVSDHDEQRAEAKTQTKSPMTDLQLNVVLAAAFAALAAGRAWPFGYPLWVSMPRRR